MQTGGLSKPVTPLQPMQRSLLDPRNHFAEPATGERKERTHRLVPFHLPSSIKTLSADVNSPVSLSPNRHPPGQSGPVVGVGTQPGSFPKEGISRWQPFPSPTWGPGRVCGPSSQPSASQRHRSLSLFKAGGQERLYSQCSKGGDAQKMSPQKENQGC